MRPLNVFALASTAFSSMIGLSSAQEPMGLLPLCALSHGTNLLEQSTDYPKAKCFQGALQNQTACSPTDVQCICTDGPFNAAIESCVGSLCSVREILGEFSFNTFRVPLIRTLLVAVNVTSTMCNRPIRDQSNLLFVTGLVSGKAALLVGGVRTFVASYQDSFGLDDAFALAAEAACLPVTVIQCITPKLGFGKDTWTVPQENIYRALKV